MPNHSSSEIPTLTGFVSLTLLLKKMYKETLTNLFTGQISEV